MPQRGTGDPWLKHPTWRKAVAHWRKQQAYRTLHCARCGQPIDRRRGLPWSLDVGHIVSRAKARAQGWTVEQANAISNTQPEHARCGRSAGARERDAMRASTSRADPRTSGVW